ncbi:hypothetical protein N656DRAFT_771457 [Canariomyces notabilis]|uniref:Anaphase-promoting complex subunit 4-like WD40 domain-containing protein n=1 Tax=Canariomyces notabilis TaxID=2074819 RepID=A0AAN6QL31_9PEZI|nr:hypothetical protein N656DRAFT_771457 [Canariomyces arenarius]
MRSPYSANEIRHLCFTPSGSHLLAAVGKGDAKLALALWSADKGTAMPRNNSAVGYSGLEVWDFCDAVKSQRLLKQDDIKIRAPVAWSPDGTMLRGHKGVEATVERLLMGHTEEVTQLAFLPHWEGDGKALVSAGKDGYVRVTNIASRKTLKKIKIEARSPPSILKVSLGGKLVVTVWGRKVVLWCLNSGRVQNYNLNVVRQSEGWPLCVSPDCRFLACRTEEGFDVSDVATATRLAVGDYCGEVHMFDIVIA